MRSYMEGKKYRENKGESAIMEKMKKYIKFARGKIFFSVTWRSLKKLRPIDRAPRPTIPLLSVEQKNGAVDRGNYSAFRSTQVALNLESMIFCSL